MRRRGGHQKDQEGEALLRVQQQPGMRVHVLAEALGAGLPQVRQLDGRKGKQADLYRGVLRVRE